MWPKPGSAVFGEDDVAGGVVCTWVRLLDWMPGRTVGLDAGLRLFCVHTIHILPIHSHIRFRSRRRVFTLKHLHLSHLGALLLRNFILVYLYSRGLVHHLVPETFSRACPFIPLGFTPCPQIASSFLYHQLLRYHHLPEGPPVIHFELLQHL